MQKAYGKTQAELGTLVDGYVWILGDYEADLVFSAMREAVKRSSEIPTPADIEAIINPVEEPPSHTLYIDIMKKVNQGDYLWGDDKDFVTKYRKYWMAKALADEKKEIRRAERKIQNHMIEKIGGITHAE